MILSFSQRLTVSPNVLVRELDCECVLLNLDSAQYFGLDAMGTHIWTTLSAARSIQEAYNTLLATYEVDADVLQRDLYRLISELIEHNLMQVDAA